MDKGQLISEWLWCLNFSRAEIHQIFELVFSKKFKTSKSHSEINWPLSTLLYSFQFCLYRALKFKFVHNFPHACTYMYIVQCTWQNISIWKFSLNSRGELFIPFQKNHPTLKIINFFITYWQERARRSIAYIWIY